MVQDVFIYLIFTDLETTGVSRKFSFFYIIASCTVPKTLAQKEKIKVFFLPNEHTFPEKSALLPQYVIKK